MTRVSQEVISELCDEIQIAPPGSSWVMETFGRVCLENPKLAEAMVIATGGNVASLAAACITYEAMDRQTRKDQLAAMEAK